MRLPSLAACLLAAFGLCGCLSTHHEEYATSAALVAGPNGLEASHDGSYSSRDWVSPWPAQPDRARP